MAVIYTCTNHNYNKLSNTCMIRYRAGLISAPIGLCIGQYTSQSERLNGFFVNTCKNFQCFDLEKSKISQI